MALSGAIPLAASATTNLFAAREQMAFTLAFHIVLACLGVALPATILVANYIGLKKDDHDAIELAQRWSKAMAVTFAVGAVTGTVLSFEFGLLWPHFMERFGAAFGIAFGIEGLFFFLEAIFLAIYIYGWKRLPPLGSTGGPACRCSSRDRRRLLRRRRQLVDEPAAGLHPRRRRQGHRSRTASRSSSTTRRPYEVPHMILAAYMVVGFLVASIYAVGMLKGRRDRLHRLGLLIPLTIACIATPLQLLVGDTAAREVAHDQPAKFAAMECIQDTGGHQTEYVGGICTSERGEVRDPDPGPRLAAGRLQPRHQGHRPELDPQRRTAAGQHLPPPRLRHDDRDRHGADAAGALARLRLVYKKRDIPTGNWFLKAVSVSGIGAILALWSGWIVTEVGRQPWIVYGYMKTSEAVTDANGIWGAFIFTLLLYTAIGTIAVLVLRRMSRRWREGGEGAAEDEPAPYSPIRPGDEVGV